jgi:Cu/Ag efflux pump CusA
VPLAAAGGVLAPWLAGLQFSSPSGIGFLTLAGFSMLDGLVLVDATRKR